MSLSAREQRILNEIERDLTAAEPLLGRALASMRPGLRRKGVTGAPARPRRGGAARRAWGIAILACLLIGLAVMSTGLALNAVPLAAGGTALTQLSLVAAWVARELRTRHRAPRRLRRRARLG